MTGTEPLAHSTHDPALQVLGLTTDDELSSAGIRLWQLQMPIPLDRHDVRAFAEGSAYQDIQGTKPQSVGVGLAPGPHS